MLSDGNDGLAWFVANANELKRMKLTFFPYQRQVEQTVFRHFPEITIAVSKILGY